MIYTLANGTNINLENIYEVSEIKDYGKDEKTIDESTISFTIRFKSGKSKKVSMNYHYSEWFDVFKQLKQVRMDIIENWENYKSQKK